MVKDIGISSKITVEDCGDKIKLKLKEYNIRKYNMQVPCNAFEGWAFAEKIINNKNVELEVDFCDTKEGEGHWNRFLYRAMKFSEQYKAWFNLSGDLASKVDDFKKNLCEGICTNNPPTKIAEDTDKIDDENAVESELSKAGVLQNVLNIDVGSQVFNRQLPVGLFKGKKSKENSIFTYGHSAIDLWNINEDTINVVELKTDNPMIGIITEIFFYSNYIYDFIYQNNFTLADIPRVKDKANLRGYDILYNSVDELKKVRGIMLADEDKYHKLLRENKDEFLIEMNKNGIEELKYSICSYKYDVTVSKY